MALLIRISLLFTTAITLSGCQVGYLIENAYYQADLLLSRDPIDEVLKDPSLPKENKRKLLLTQEARIFAENELGLKKSKNYTSYVDLGRPSVVHALTVSPKHKLEAYTWSFPFFGSFPYLGYFNKRSGELAQKKFKAGGYDTYLRGVSAFSTLGWFKDPILSSMMRYSDYSLVNLIIHETVHATIYIKDAADFNERLATFVGNKGAELYFKKKEGENSETLKGAEAESHDDDVFSAFISKELDALKKWYSQQKPPIAEEKRKEQFKKLQDAFVAKAKPKMKSDSYDWFPKAKLNNARLLNYQTYFSNLDEFDRVYEKLGRSFPKLIEFCKKLEDVDDPEAALKKAANAENIAHFFVDQK